MLNCSLSLTFQSLDSYRRRLWRGSPGTCPAPIIEKCPCIYHFLHSASQYFGFPTQYFGQVYASDLIFTTDKSDAPAGPTCRPYIIFNVDIPYCPGQTQGNLFRALPAQPRSNNLVLRPERNRAEWPEAPGLRLKTGAGKISTIFF